MRQLRKNIPKKVHDESKEKMINFTYLNIVSPPPPWLINSIILTLQSDDNVYRDHIMQRDSHLRGDWQPDELLYLG